MIESEKQAAERIATEMRSALEKMNEASGRTVSYAERTTLAVNEEAKSTFQEMKNVVTSFNQAFQQTVNNLQSVEEQFQATDIELQRNFDRFLNNTQK